MRLSVRGFLIVISLVLVSASAACSKNFVVMNFEPEKGSMAPSWLGYVLSATLRSKIQMVPGFRLLCWDDIVQMECIHSRNWPTKPFSASELAAMSHWNNDVSVIVARYRIQDGKLYLHYRVWDESRLKDVTRNFPLASAYKAVADLSTEVCLICCTPNDSVLLEKMRPSSVHNAQSFEPYGCALEALVDHKAKEARLLADKWTKIDQDSPTVWLSYTEIDKKSPDNTILLKGIQSRSGLLQRIGTAYYRILEAEQKRRGGRDL